MKMYGKISGFALSCLILFAACSKTDDNINRCVPLNVPASSQDQTNLQAYISANAISAVADPRGFFYIIHRNGDTTNRPTVCSSVRVGYTGRLTNGNQFDAAANSAFQLGNLILGWQEGIPLIGEGGSITLYIPPSLGYGSTPKTGIPANSILVFTIDLLDVL
jgi:FKBP-type peptidyl-prolyl cis-trans isomerase FkpA